MIFARKIAFIELSFNEVIFLIVKSNAVQQSIRNS